MAGLIRTEAEYRELLLDLGRLGTEPLAIDTETTGLHLYAGDVIRGISLGYRWGGELRTWYLPVSHPDRAFNPGKLLVALRAHKGHHIYHHGDFDWAAIAQVAGGYYMPPREMHFDTQVGDWLIDENDRHALKVIAKRLFGEDEGAERAALAAIRKGPRRDDLYREARAQDPPMPVKDARKWAAEEQERRRRDWPTFTSEDIGPYACMDASQTYRVMEWELAHLDESLPAVGRENRFQRVIYEIMRTGVRVDTARLEGYEEQAKVKLAKHEEWFASVASSVKGNRPASLTKNADVEHYLYDQLGLPCYERTESGGRSVNRAALEAVQADCDDVGLILDFRRYQKAQTAFYDPILTKTGNDGRIHTSLSSTRTVTGRLSSSDPNMQTIPKEQIIAGLKSCFVPTDGFELWEYDLSQAELRVMASLSMDSRMIEALEERDLHDETARMIFGDGFDDIQRRFAKNLNFGFAYGIGARKFARYMAVGPPRVPVTNTLIYRAEVILDGFRAAYPDLVRTMKALDRWAEVHGTVPSHIPGRFRHFKTQAARIKGAKTYTALNFAVQGGIAELMKDVMIEAVLNHRIEGLVVLQVHDSLWIEVAPGTGELVQKQLQGILDGVNPFHMPMTFDATPLHKSTTPLDEDDDHIDAIGKEV